MTQWPSILVEIQPSIFLGIATTIDSPGIQPPAGHPVRVDEVRRETVDGKLWVLWMVVPSGYFPYGCYWKWPIELDLATKNGDFFHKLPRVSLVDSKITWNFTKQFGGWPMDNAVGDITQKYRGIMGILLAISPFQLHLQVMIQI